MISVKGNLTGKLNTTYTKIYPELENLTVTPSEEQQKFIHEDRYGYDKVVVNPIPDKYIIPSGALDITENGNYNVKEKEFANVNVPTKTLRTKTITTNGTYLAIDDGVDGYSEVEVATSGVDINDYIKPETINTATTMVGCWHTFIKKIPKLNLNITTTCANMFFHCQAEEIDVSEFNTTNVTNMYQMFSGCSSLTNLDLSSFNTSNVTNMNSMFNGCKALTSLDVSSFNISKVTHMISMFDGCKALTSLDLSSFNTSKVTTMQSMFNGCKALTSLDLSSFNTSNVTNMTSMFRDCSSLTSLDLSIFNTSKVTTMQSMFYGCTRLINLDLSSFNTSNVTNMTSMFSYCSSLTSLDLSSFNTSKITNMSYLFDDCTKLKNLNISNFDFTNVTIYTNIFHSVPNDCYILVKDATAKDWITSKFTNLTNIHYVGEIE